MYHKLISKGVSDSSTIKVVGRRSLRVLGRSRWKEKTSNTPTPSATVVNEEGSVKFEFGGGFFSGVKGIERRGVFEVAPLQEEKEEPGDGGGGAVEEAGEVSHKVIQMVKGEAKIKGQDYVAIADASELRMICAKATDLHIFNLAFWRHVAARTRELVVSNQMDIKNLSLILNYFKQMRIKDEEMFLGYKGFVLQNLHKCNLQDMSLLAFTYSYFNFADHDFLQALCDKVVKVCKEKPEVREDEEWRTWAHLAIACCKAGLAHKELFEHAAPTLCLAANKLRSKHVVTLVQGLAQFGFRHMR
eukprot:Platyproteum_vivax@DN4406_c0_g1_i4.p1